MPKCKVKNVHKMEYQIVVDGQTVSVLVRECSSRAAEHDSRCQTDLFIDE